jgi:ribonuclease HII
MLETRYKKDSVIEIGIDEAGRGCFWGPIVAGAVIIPDTVNDAQIQILKQIRDSKKLNAVKREYITDKLKELFPPNNIGVGFVNADEINEHGISWANQEAFRRALNCLEIKDNCRLIIDGAIKIPELEMEKVLEQQLIEEGDNKYIAIAAASIIAKVEHDNWINKYCESNPDCDTKYDLIKSKGYGTVKHRDGIRAHGSHEFHRSLFIQNWLPGNQVRQNKKNNTKVFESFLIKF